MAYLPKCASYSQPSGVPIVNEAPSRSNAVK
jgi:hypothetical protein